MRVIGSGQRIADNKTELNRIKTRNESKKYKTYRIMSVTGNEKRDGETFKIRHHRGRESEDTTRDTIN